MVSFEMDERFFRNEGRSALRAHKEIRPDLLALDTETNGVFFHSEAFAATIAFRAGEEIVAFYFELSIPECKKALKEIIFSSSTLIFFNAKFDLHKLILARIMDWNSLDSFVFEDCEVIFHLIEPTSRRGLDHLAYRLLGIESPETVELENTRKKLGIPKEEGYVNIPRDILVPYAKSDAVKTLLLYEHLWPRFLEENDRLLEIYHLEQELTRVLLEIESNGIGVDSDLLTDLIFRYDEEVREQKERLVKLSGLDSYNPNSWQQTLRVLNTRGFYPESTCKEELHKIKDDEFVTALLGYREVKKIYSTYLLNMSKEIRDGVIYPNFQQHTRTGRMSSRTKME